MTSPRTTLTLGQSAPLLDRSSACATFHPATKEENMFLRRDLRPDADYFANTINDTQVQGMARAILDNYRSWKEQTRETYPQVEEIDVILGLTYGTDRTTNNK
jgi:hypothetical protein